MNREYGINELQSLLDDRVTEVCIIRILSSIGNCLFLAITIGSSQI